MVLLQYTTFPYFSDLHHKEPIARPLDTLDTSTTACFETTLIAIVAISATVEAIATIAASIYPQFVCLFDTLMPTHAARRPSIDKRCLKSEFGGEN